MALSPLAAPPPRPLAQAKIWVQLFRFAAKVQCVQQSNNIFSCRNKKEWCLAPPFMQIQHAPLRGVELCHSLR